MNRFAAVVALLLLAAPTSAAVTRYTDQATSEADLAALGVSIVHEGFEDDAAWGDVRSPNSAYAVTSQGITFTANSVNCGVTTGSGPARTGQYGFFEIPHGDPQNGITDGWILSGDGILYGAGGWVETNTFGARINLVLDGTTVVDFEDVPLDYAHQFYGVIDTDGFAAVAVTETEAVIDDQ